MACTCQIITDFIKMLTATAKLVGFFVFYFPYNAPHYQSKSPFETVITLRMHPKTKYYLRKCIDKEPFFFVYDPEKEIKRFIHKKALVFIEFESVWLSFVFVFFNFFEGSNSLERKSS